MTTVTATGIIIATAKDLTEVLKHTKYIIFRFQQIITIDDRPMWKVLIFYVKDNYL